MSNDVTCTSLKIVDSKGKVKIALTTDDNDNALIVLASSDNNEPAIILAGGTAHTNLGANIQIRDINGDLKVALQTIKDEGYIVASGQLIDSRQENVEIPGLTYDVLA